MYVQSDTRGVEIHGGFLICKGGSTPACSLPEATHVLLQPEAFGPESASMPSRLGVVRAIWGRSFDVRCSEGGFHADR
jgi:hypothetical protein